MAPGKRRSDAPVDLRQGTLDLLILRVLAWGPIHGHDIVKAIERASEDALLIDHTFRADLMLDSLALNAVLFVASFVIFLALLRSAKRHGSLLGGGE